MRSATALVSEIRPKSFQMPPPLVENCQRPGAASTEWPRTATPASWFWPGLPASAASLKLPAYSAATVAPPGDAASSSAAARLAAPLAMGASLTAVTVMPAAAVALLNALVPPLVEVSAVLPAMPLVASQARKVMPLPTLPFQSALGTKRTYVLEGSAASSLAMLAVGVPKAVQVERPLVEYCQLPLLLSTAMTAMPLLAPASASLTLPAIRLATLTPWLELGSSARFARLFAPDSTGALLTTVASSAAENSEVLPLLSVAVALIQYPGEAAMLKAALVKLTLPLVAVVTDMLPSQVLPSP